jgi:hypothetical protein
VVGQAVPGEPQDEPVDELRVADGEPDRVAAAGRDAEDADRATELGADDRRVVIGDVG